MGDNLNCNNVSLVPQIQHSSSDRNNNSENFANPFSFHGNVDGVLETTPEMLRNFLYDVRDMKRYKNGILSGIREYENIKSSNPGMEVAEQLWETTLDKNFRSLLLPSS